MQLEIIILSEVNKDKYHVISLICESFKKYKWEWIKKLWYTYTMEYYSAIKKNAFESFLMRWMKLEPNIQSEVSQKEKHEYITLTHIYGI